MLVLGVDPGTAICGYGLIERRGSRLASLDYGVITTSTKMRMEQRLFKIYNELTDIIKVHHPKIIGVEQLFFNRNITTAIPVGQARGVILLAAAQSSIEIVERTPLQVKQAVTGYGNATKEQIIYMVTRILNLPEPPKPDDAADALAVAISAIQLSNTIKWRNKR